MYTPSQLNRIVEGTLLREGAAIPVAYLLTDSRKLVFPAQTVFFALKGEKRNGHLFVEELYAKGVRCFVVSDVVETELYPEADVIRVKDTLEALQLLAAHHRQQFTYPVIGITGSNGKTIVKEWLNQLLEHRFHIVRSPRSYNSQIGVPLSLWQMGPDHELGIFEAGISTEGEMQKLEKMIAPDIGILTHIGEAHDEGFSGISEKIREKLFLFSNAAHFIYNSDDVRVNEAVIKLKAERVLKGTPFTWGRNTSADLQLLEQRTEQGITEVKALYEGIEQQLVLPFTDNAALENALSCWCALLVLKIPVAELLPAFLSLSNVAMRLELKKGILQSAIINDSYSADLGSLRIALEFLSQQRQHEIKTVILSDIPQHGLDPERVYTTVATELRQHKVKRFIGIGQEIAKHKAAFSADTSLETIFYNDTSAFKNDFRPETFRNQAILLKGARSFGFEQISQLLEQKVHQTVLEINLSSLAQNLRAYKSLIAPTTKLMAMVKAFSYGSGSVEIAAHLQFHQVDYLTVAYADEGVELRKGGITMPIMVMNPEPATFESILQYDLEPDIYSFQLLDELEQFMRRQGVVDYPVHLELETGMNRLGFPLNDVKRLGERIRQSGVFRVKAVFSHLVASEDPQQDTFTTTQAALFNGAVAELESLIPYPFLKHILNTAGIARHPELQLDMVRLGIGLYGINTTEDVALPLQAVSTLRSTIAQLKKLHPGDTVSYGRRGQIERESLIATVRIGYADGYPRRLGNGAGKMWVNGHLAPTIGSVCMDMTMIDVTGIPGVKEGGNVVVFGPELPVEQVAKWAGTIPYEILTGVSQRVKRVYFEE